MPRGEPAPRGNRGPGLAIGAAFTVVCLGALYLVLRTQQGCDTGYAPPALPSEPFPGARAALVQLGSRTCLSAGLALPPPGVPAPVAGGPTAEVEAELTARGYVTASPWGAPWALPHRFEPEGLEGACGVLAVVADSGSITRQVGPGGPAKPCDDRAALVAVCDGDGVDLERAALTRARSFALPGITPELVAATGLEIELLLAHAEAEAMLRTLGFRPEDEVVLTSVAPGTAYSSHPLTPPATPPAGCVVWVAAGAGLGTATTTHDAIALDHDPAPDRFTVGLVSCAPRSGSTGSTTVGQVVDLGGDGGRIAWRVYAPSAGPAVPSPVGTTRLTASGIRTVDARHAAVPAGVAEEVPPDLEP